MSLIMVMMMMMMVMMTWIWQVQNGNSIIIMDMFFGVYWKNTYIISFAQTKDEEGWKGGLEIQSLFQSDTKILGGGLKPPTRKCRCSFNVLRAPGFRLLWNTLLETNSNFAPENQLENESLAFCGCRKSPIFRDDFWVTPPWSPVPPSPSWSPALLSSWCSEKVGFVCFLEGSFRGVKGR